MERVVLQTAVPPLDALHNATSSLSKRFADAFVEVERVMEKLWLLVDESASMCTTYKSLEDDDVPQTLTAMRKIYATSSSIQDTLCTFVKDLNPKTELFSCAVDGSEMRISQKAMEYGLNLLPDELLTHILVLAGSNVEETMLSVQETIALSHVGKRFRSVILSQRKFWNNFTLHTTWNAEQILAVAERSGFGSLQAIIDDRLSHTNDNFLSSTKAILSLHPYLGELSLYWTKMRGGEEMWHAFDETNAPALHSLYIASASWTGQTTVTPSYFYDLCDIPSLRALDVGFIPRSSSARNLVTCTLKLGSQTGLKRLLDFLSSAERLQELVVAVYSSFCNGDNSDELHAVSIPSLVSLTLYWNLEDRNNLMAQLFVENVRLSAMRRLHLKGFNVILNPRFAPLLHIMDASPFTQDLILDVDGSSLLDLGVVLASIPEHLRTLTIGARSIRLIPTDRGTASYRAFRLQRVTFENYLEVSNDLVGSVRDFFATIGLAEVQIACWDCYGLLDGIYTLDTVESAFEPEDS